jgi:type II secretory pathway component PulF
MNPAAPMLAALGPELAQFGPADSVTGIVGVFLGVTLVVVPPLLGLLYLGYFLFSLPLRRQERARLLLDVIETGLERGESPERTVLGVAAQRERKLGKPFRRLASRLEEGLRFGEGLELTPGLVPPQVAAMLKAGLELGDLRKVLPGCRRLLRDGALQVSHAHHYLMLLAFATSPMWIAVFWMLCVFVLPKFEQIGMDLGAVSPGLMHGLLEWRSLLLSGQFLLIGALWLGALVYCGGPRFTNWLARHSPFSWDHLVSRVPWRRRRLQRDFSTVLAVALDAGLSEARAVMLAGEGTGNESFRARAVAAVQDLQRGITLPEALARMDDAGEFRWRLANAVFGGGGFSAALSGWQEALDAKAFQQEQIAAQLASTSLVLLNGVLVALLAVGVFQMLVNLVWSAVLW